MFHKNTSTASVDLQHRTVRIATVFPTIQSNTSFGLRLDGIAKHELAWREAMIEGLLAHEAGHVRFSIAKPAASTLGWLVNALEDERIERLMQADNPKLKKLFDVLGDVFLREALGSRNFGNSLNGCLLWRWAHDRITWKADKPSEWDEIRPLVEQSWIAPDMNVVIGLAKQILNILGIEEHADSDALPRVTMDGAGFGSSPDPCHDQAPIPPSVAGSSEQVLLEIESVARQLAKKLRPPAKPGLKLAVRSGGKFSFRRKVARLERQFVKKVLPIKPKALDVVLLLDQSYSMEGAQKMQSALRCATIIARSAQLATCNLAVASFNDRHITHLEPNQNIEAVFARLSKISSAGGTRLAQSLAWAMQQMKATQNSLPTVIVISDGALTKDDSLLCKKICQQRKQVRVWPLLIGDDSDAASYRLAFGRCVVIRHAEELPEAVSAIMST